MQVLPIKYEDLTILVSADYYMEDGIRMPVDLPRAYEIADEYDMLLPTVDMVDAIWEQADIRLDPQPLPPGPEMTKISYFRRHNDLIEDQLSGMDTKGKLIAGHKKDLIRVRRNSPKVAIYGWHRSNGKPIQPYSTVHGSYYADYSHGLRLISKTAYRGDDLVRLG